MSRCACQEINISLCDELVILDSELAKKLFCDSPSIDLCLLGTKHNLKFQKIAQSFDGVYVDPSLPNHKENSSLFHFTDPAEGSGQNIEQNFRRRSACN